MPRPEASGTASAKMPTGAARSRPATMRCITSATPAATPMTGSRRPGSSFASARPNMTAKITTGRIIPSAAERMTLTGTSSRAHCAIVGSVPGPGVASAGVEALRSAIAASRSTCTRSSNGRATARLSVMAAISRMVPPITARTPARPRPLEPAAAPEAADEQRGHERQHGHADQVDEDRADRGENADDRAGRRRGYGGQAEAQQEPGQ